MRSDDDRVSAVLDALRPVVEVLLTPLPSVPEQRSEPEQSLTQGKLAQTLDISIPTLKKLIDEGMPYMPAGDHKRFDRQRVFDWLHERAQAGAV